MRICLPRPHRASLLGVAALTIALTGQPAAAQGTAGQRAACQGDAMRLCNQYVPDVQRITACMAQHRRYLSPGCRAAFYGGAKKKRVRRARY